MNNQILAFSYDNSQIRFVEDGGVIEIVAADLAAQLGYGQAKDMLRSLDDDEKGRRLMPTPGGQQELTTVTEAGMYRAILLRQTGRMADPAIREGVKNFQRWVTHDVLPAIRRTGSYSIANHISPELMAQIPKTYPEALHALAREVESREATEAYARQLEPKADNYDRFMSGEGSYSVGAAGKMLGVSQNKLFQLCRNAKIFIAKGHMRNTPYQQYMHHFEVKAFEFQRSDGSSHVAYTTRVQPSGLEFLARKLGLVLNKDLGLAA